MALGIPIVCSDAHRLHEPGGEVWVGVRTPAVEVPARAERIRAAVAAAGATAVNADTHPDEVALRFHDPAMVAWLREAWERWQRSGLTEDPGQDRVVPYLSPHPGLLGPLPAPTPVAPAALAGRWCFDTMTLIGPGSWEAARAAVDAALTAGDLVAAGEPAAYALCRPPGHHATRDAYGGSCYLNNAAAAAGLLRDRLDDPVALLDIDAHHGNGAQSIFWTDPHVATGSVHVDPGAGWFPHFLGFAGEVGGGEAAGSNLNLPLAPGSDDGPWLEAVAELCDFARGAGARGLVVALGVDAATADPESPLAVTAAGYRAAGELLGALGLPTVVVQEGGYDLDAIGELVVATLEGIDR
ncbi:MAG: acetylpolyamine amidohydrolase [Actinomycetes bacterium]|nr:MAG: acetylpolyamine amidohydrolase [Actinomycetes bacterium]